MCPRARQVRPVVGGAHAAIPFSADHDARLAAGSLLANPERLGATLAACDRLVPAECLSAGAYAEMRRRFELAARTMRGR